MNKKEVNYYFKSFAESFDFAIQAINYLEVVVDNFKGGITEKQKSKMHLIEHDADLYLRDALERLAKEFITPIESEDILSIIRSIDDATDYIEDVLINMYIYNAKKLPSCTTKFISIIKRECNALAVVLDEFPNFKRSKILKDKIMEVLSIEEEGDELFLTSMRELYQNGGDLRDIYIAETIIRSLESCCDIIEVIAQGIDEAVMKNS